jgi:hypothetical protein
MGDCRSDDFRFLIAPPIVIGGDERAVTVMEFERWILQRLGYTEIRQAGTNRTKESANHCVVTRSDERAQGV